MKVLSKICIAIIALSLVFSQQSCTKDNDDSQIGTKDGFNYGKAPGNNAQDYVSDDVYSALSVQILYMPDAKPTNGALNNLESFLEEFLDKDEIQLVVTEIKSENNESYSVDDLREIERDNRKVFNSENSFSASMLFVDADFSGNTGEGKVLGVAYNNTSMAVFEKTLQDNAGGLFQPSLTTVETTVMNHEFGHLMGLVNNGAPLTSDHHDSDRGAHCTESDCLMYFAVEGSDFITNLRGGNIPSLDAQCQNDLNSLR
jgi:hypothetical protein